MPGFRRAITVTPPPAPLDGGLTTLSACDEEVGPAGCHAPNPLSSLALLLTHHGRAEGYADGVAFVHRPRRLVAVAADVIYEERLATGAWWHLSYLLLKGAWCEPLNHALRQRRGGVLVVEDAPLALRDRLGSTVETVLAQNRDWAWPALAGLAGLVAELLALAQDTDRSLTARVARLIDQEPQRAWTIAGLAARLRLTTATFVRRFRVDAGESPAAWIRRRRIDHARRLLAQSLDVATVADRLGFANPYHFSRVFKAITGVPPSQVRRARDASPLHAGGG